MKKIHILLAALAFFGVVSCVDNDDDIPMNYYQSKKVTAAGFLEDHQEQFSEFIAILKKTPYFSMLSTYGEFTLFACLKLTECTLTQLVDLVPTLSLVTETEAALSIVKHYVRKTLPVDWSWAPVTVSPALIVGRSGTPHL